MRAKGEQGPDTEATHKIERIEGRKGPADKRSQEFSAESVRCSGTQALYTVLNALGHRLEVSRACHIWRTFKRCYLRGRGSHPILLYCVVRQADKETDRAWETGGNGASHACSVDQERI
jgi:hypothetical protein